MLAALRVWWRALRHCNHFGYRYIWTNLAWFALTLPVLTAPAAWAGFVAVSHRLYNHQPAGLAEFWEAFKANLGRGVLMALANALFVWMTVVNLVAYAGEEGPLFSVLRAAWVFSLAVWFMVQVYLYPLLLEMEQPTLLGGLRNALVMVGLNPLFSLTMVGLFVVLFSLATVVIALWALVAGGVMSAVATGAVLDRLAAAGVRAPVSDPSTPPDTHDVDIV